MFYLSVWGALDLESISSLVLNFYSKPVKMDLNKNKLLKQKTIRTFRIRMVGFCFMAIFELLGIKFKDLDSLLLN